MIQKLLLLIVLITLLPACQSNRAIIKDIDAIHKQEKKGIKLYHQQAYPEAFEALSELATWGYKDAQYYLAFMFLKGQHVEQSTLIGMGWLSVAAESGIEEWVNFYDALYGKATPQMQQKIDKVAADYKRKFGLKAQFVTCRHSTSVGSNRVAVKCTKEDKISTVYPLDLNETQLNLE
ncbi:sel1 repeat family protein [Pseudoalteromonas obscura]|uniref:Sel1 repeat family protein n=1 Tax=Pseudoalteromonas obscura TaxID=3048491 RepID=A0ABT7EGK4_9GAMM|nr:sel1 repeat family protein [Pseudoalteromonas sp. P94(2023)]MDK2594158.1 sel1 repeat family protein [Pseudoalteromonas sp. P94(2023)]